MKYQADVLYPMSIIQRRLRGERFATLVSGLSLASSSHEIHMFPFRFLESCLPGIQVERFFAIGGGGPVRLAFLWGEL